jgi:hypothetical protein
VARGFEDMLQTSYLSEMILSDGISTVPGGKINPLYLQQNYGRLLGVIGPFPSAYS